MNRRSLLAALAAASGLALAAPAGLMAQGGNAFDLAIQAQELLAQGKYAQALVPLAKAADMDPRNEWVWGLMGRAYFQLGDMRKALDSFRKALSLNPEDTYSRMMVEVISQKPVPPKEKKSKPLSKLEKLALNEEKEFEKHYASAPGLGYRVGRVVLDAGHGGFDSGAVGPGGLQEKNVNLDLAKRTAAVLDATAKGIKVFLSRTEDYYMPLSARTTFANQYSADLFVSFHVNANQSPKPHGTETYFCSETASNKEAARVADFENSVLKLDREPLVKKGYLDIEDILFRFERGRYWEAGGAAANAFQQAMKKSLPMHSRGVNSANFYVLRRARMPSILLEVGFISNPDNEAQLNNPDMRAKIAESLALSVMALGKEGI